MRCLKPRTVGFQADGKTICWSPKSYSKEYATFQLPCGKCIECRLSYAREWAIRSVHESQMYEDNCFVTLTYNDENLGDNRLDYKDFQGFVFRLRDRIFSEFCKKSFGRTLNNTEKKQLRKDCKNELEKIRISVFCTGEYGDQGKRKHWHALIFNWRPSDGVYKYSNDRGDKSYSSVILDDLWGKGITEFGDITIESAGYCARYATKKLVHGADHEHDLHPISKKSFKNAIGKKWLEKYWSDVFNYGYVVLKDSTKTSVPRYYEKWFKKHKPELWEQFVVNVKSARTLLAAERAEKYESELRAINEKRSGLKGPMVTSLDHKAKIIQQKLKQLNEHLKL